MCVGGALYLYTFVFLADVLSVLVSLVAVRVCAALLLEARVFRAQESVAEIFLTIALGRV